MTVPWIWPFLTFDLGGMVQRSHFNEKRQVHYFLGTKERHSGVVTDLGKHVEKDWVQPRLTSTIEMAI